MELRLKLMYRHPVCLLLRLVIHSNRIQLLISKLSPSDFSCVLVASNLESQLYTLLDVIFGKSFSVVKVPHG